MCIILLEGGWDIILFRPWITTKRFLWKVQEVSVTHWRSTSGMGGENSWSARKMVDSWLSIRTENVFLSANRLINHTNALLAMYKTIGHWDSLFICVWVCACVVTLCFCVLKRHSDSFSLFVICWNRFIWVFWLLCTSANNSPLNQLTSLFVVLCLCWMCKNVDADY